MSIAAVQKLTDLQQNQAKAEAAEDKVAAAAEVEKGFLKVRLINPAYIDGVLHAKGIHTLPADKVPASAKKLKE